MRSVKAQYFLSFAMVGSLAPYVALYFKQNGLAEGQIGYILAASSLAVVLAPVLVTFLADTRLDPRRIMAGMFLLSALTLLAVPAAWGFWAILGAWTLHAVVSAPILSLQDGIYFSIQERERRNGAVTAPYHRIRVWGTIGFIVPSLLFFALLRMEFPMGAMAVVGASFAVLGVINALRLPEPQRSAEGGSSMLPPGVRLPTLAALEVLMRPPVLVFCVAVFLLQATSSAHFMFYPIYLTEWVGMDKSWVAPVVNLGVVVEVFFVLGFGWFISRMGLKLMMVAGVACVAVRMALTAAWPTPLVAVGTQIFHGMSVLLLHIAPVVFLNRHADDRYRHSMQGLYAMLVVGMSRIVGNAVAGPVAEWSVVGMYGYAAAVSLAAGALIVVAFRESEGEGVLQAESRGAAAIPKPE